MHSSGISVRYLKTSAGPKYRYEVDPVPNHRELTGKEAYMFVQYCIYIGYRCRVTAELPCDPDALSIAVRLKAVRITASDQWRRKHVQRQRGQLPPVLKARG